MLVALLLVCQAVAWRTSRAGPPGDLGERATADDVQVTSSDRLRWLGLAAIPVSLMLSVTTYI